MVEYLGLLKKRIQFNYNKKNISFDVHQSLFSSAHIDKGTFQLIDSLRKNEKIKYDSVLDIGCGYGPIGISLKKIHPNSIINCVDRDALALEFTKHNAILNKCEIESYASLEYEEVKKEFDLICCNYPAKAGIKTFKRILYGASEHLKKNGVLVIVIVKELLEDFNSILKEEIKVIYKKQSAGHFVFHLKFNDKIIFEEEPHFRKDIKYSIGNQIYKLKTAYNLAEFETPSFTTQAIINLLENLKKKSDISIINPFQGHLPIAIFHYLEPKKINLISRDLLSLKYSKNNLNFNNINCVNNFHQILNNKLNGDILIWNLRDDIGMSQFKEEFEMIKNNFKNIIIGTRKSKLIKIINSLNIKYTKEEIHENGMAILI